MRPIKFRAWDKQENKMWSWEELNEFDRDGSIVLFDVLTDDNFYIPMQYIGLHDANNREIYEGDLVQFYGGERCQGYWEHNITGRVEYRGTAFYIHTMHKETLIYLDELPDGEIFVVGNIYTGLETLKEVNDG